MRRARKGNIFTIICITTGLLIACGGIVYTFNFLQNNTCSEEIPSASEEVYVQEEISSATTTSFAPATKETTAVTVIEPTLNQEKPSNMSASKQSSLEKAIDDLIIMTESE